MKVVVHNVKEIVALLASGEAYEERTVVFSPDERRTELLLHEDGHLVADGHEVVGSVWATGRGLGSLSAILLLGLNPSSAFDRWTATFSPGEKECAAVEEAEVWVVDADGESKCSLRQFVPGHSHYYRNRL